MTDHRILFPQPILPNTQPAKPQSKGTPGKPGEFAEILKNKTGELRFSGHALERLAKRNIVINPNQLNRLEEAVEKAAQKGAKDSLILMGSTAFVVSVKNKTVITAVDGNSLQDNVFTNIDSAVILPG